MIQLSDRTRRGLVEAMGIPGIIAGLMLLLLVFGRIFGAAA
jgi:gamma-glutamyltranspeptidase